MKMIWIMAIPVALILFGGAINHAILLPIESKVGQSQQNQTEEN